MRNRQARTAAGAVGLVMAVVGLAGCGLGVTIPEEDEGPMLRTYQVPADYQDQIQRMLRSVLGSGDTRIGRVTAGPGGTLLVVAPPRVHSGVARMLEDDFVPPPPAVPVTIDYWLLVGRPLDGGEPGEVVTVPGRDAPRLEAVMAEVAAAQGPTEFALLEQTRVTSLEQETASASGANGRFGQTVTRAGDRLVADLVVTSLNSQNSLVTRVSLVEDQYVVLGQVGYGGPRGSLFADSAEGEVLTLYYVIRADFE